MRRANRWRVLAPEDLSALRLASVMSTVVFAATRHRPGVVDSVGERSGPPNDDDLRLLARMYWFQWVSWGNPRQMIMASFGLPRSTANEWIRKARALPATRYLAFQRRG